jgi:hypothetical protein
MASVPQNLLVVDFDKSKIALATAFLLNLM